MHFLLIEFAFFVFVGYICKVLLDDGLKQLGILNGNLMLDVSGSSPI